MEEDEEGSCEQVAGEESVAPPVHSQRRLDTRVEWLTCCPERR